MTTPADIWRAIRPGLFAAAVLSAMLWTTACQEVGVDSSGVATVRIHDTVIVTVTRTDTVITRDSIVITDTLIRQVTVHDTLTRTDTLVVHDTVPRPELSRRATIFLRNVAGEIDSLVLDIAHFSDLNVVAAPRRMPTDIAFETMIPLGRLITADRFQLAGLQSLYLNLTSRRFKLQPMGLSDDPETSAGGASVVYKGRRLATGDVVGSYRSFATFHVRGIDTLRRMLRGDLDATFVRERDGQPDAPVILKVVFRMDY